MPVSGLASAVAEAERAIRDIRLQIEGVADDVNRLTADLRLQVGDLKDQAGEMKKRIDAIVARVEADLAEAVQLRQMALDWLAKPWWRRALAILGFH